MKRVTIILFMIIKLSSAFSQITDLAPGGFKHVSIGSYNGNGDYTRNLILLHEAFNGSLIDANYAIGTIQALRGSAGSWNRFNVVNLNTTSAHGNISGSLISTHNNASEWKLKTCKFNGKKYLALEVPYDVAMHDHGYKFSGWTFSTGENMLSVSYEVNGVPSNQDVLTEIQDFQADNVETHSVKGLNILGSVGIGTTDPKEYKLAVNGKIRSTEIKVENANWPDYVFAKGYQLPSLKETEKHIKEQGHLPGIPSAREVKADGFELGAMDAKLLQKIEELTLYIIDLEKRMKAMELKNKLNTGS